MSESLGKRTVGWVAGVALTAVVAGVTGCSNDSGSDSDSDADSAANEKPETKSSAPADPEQPPGEDGATADPSAPRQSSGQEAIASWVTAIIKNQPRKACLVMAEPAKGSTPAQVGSPEMCNGKGTEGKQMKEGLGRFRESFTPKPPTDNPKVEVAQVPATGGKMDVPADKVTVDGQTLHEIILSHSTGMKPGQLDVRFEASEIKGAWYVTNLDFNIG
ncbi:hypothetical protein DVA86_07035 [Streptomyces armeniacus]|uniref:Lipoprotein n=1 Tax=Streptomyces armeniacus TaxID=83291 RepID=A0A345XZS9_9ACTN|nr:hypothetical protein DVA86_07035 [Streptomyces armeniacus]